MKTGYVQFMGYQSYSDVTIKHYFVEKPPKEKPQTVRTNSRQELVNNGKRQWPKVKARKDHR